MFSLPKSPATITTATTNKTQFILLFFLFLTMLTIIHQCIIRPQLPSLLGVADIIAAYDTSMLDFITYQRQRQQPPNRVLCLFLKNKSRFLTEWVNFHFLVGWNHVMLFDDGSTDNLVSIIQQLNVQYPGQIDYVPANWIGNARSAGQKRALLQFEAYNRCFNKHWQTSEIIATTDIDEFVYPCSRDKNITFEKAMEDFSTISDGTLNYGTSVVMQLECYRYGINGHEKPHNNNILTSYSRRAAYQGDGDEVYNNLPSSITTRCNELPFEHFCDRSQPPDCYSCKRLYYPNGKATPLFPTIHNFWGSAKRIFSSPTRKQGFCCNHYFFLSYKDVIEKYRANGAEEALDTVLHLSIHDIVWSFYERVIDIEIVQYLEWVVNK
jgi:hypothetical protein